MNAVTSFLQLLSFRTTNFSVSVLIHILVSSFEVGAMEAFIRRHTLCLSHPIQL